MIGLVIFSIACFILSGISKACADKVEFHFDQSVFKSFNKYYFDPHFSWQNKWKKDKNGDIIFPEGDKMEPKFFGSTTFLAFTTDFWHLMDTFRTTFMQLPFVAAFMAYAGFNWYGAIFVLFIVKFIIGATFELLYSKILRA